MALPQERDKVFSQWWTKIQKRVLSIAQQYMELGEVEDLAQDVAIAAYQQIDSFNDENHFNAWVTNCARWFSIDRFRSRNQRATDSLDSDDSLDSVVSTRATQDISTWLSEVKEAFETLPHSQREALRLWAEGYSSKEIAVQLGVKEATVRSLRRHARIKLLGILFRKQEKRL